MPKETLPVIAGKDNPILRKKNEALASIGRQERVLIDDMFAKMQELEGIGLAAPQIGKNIMLFIVDSLAFDPDRSEWIFEGIKNPDLSTGCAFINPVISTFPKPYEAMIEGCLSLPGWEGHVTRSKRVTIKAQNKKGEHFSLRARGLLAKVLQHEYDHLQSLLIADKWEHPKEVKREKRLKTADRYRSIVFFGSPPYGDIVLRKLVDAGLRPLVVHKGAQDSLKKDSYDLGILTAYGEILSREILQKFKRGILNIHPSLLPKYRGPSPVQQTLINGDAKTGVTIIKLVKEVDAGPMLAQKQITLDELYTTGELSERLFSEGADLLLEYLPAYLKGDAILLPQEEKAVSYTQLIQKEDAHIDWSQDASFIERNIRAYQPWPVAYTFFDHRGIKKRLQILKAEVSESSQSGFIVPCGKDYLRIGKVRPEGKNEMTGEEFLRGYGLPKFE